MARTERYMRTFHCKRCGGLASLDAVSQVLTIVECSPCDVTEAWGNDPTGEEMDLFRIRDVKMAEA